MKVLAVVGLPASGKGEVSNIAKEGGIPVVVMGDVIRQTAREEGLPVTDANLGAISRRLREEYGPDALAILTIPQIEATGAPLVLVDGIRSETEVATYKSHFDTFHLLAVEAPFELRLARLAARARDESDNLTADELRARDGRECGWGLDKAMAIADYRLENTGTIESFGRQIKDLLAILRE